MLAQRENLTAWACVCWWLPACEGGPGTPWAFVLEVVLPYTPQIIRVPASEVACSRGRQTPKEQEEHPQLPFKACGYLHLLTLVALPAIRRHLHASRGSLLRLHE